ncbi:MAG: fumarate hydratase C-terminal domain-containing protein [Candidatus Bathyarchaeota archaeon]|nr:MAG: fumarate hydratase C-terminal domain-containing protein [Candidatus Bathyarchaeota archaeon]
MNVHRLKVPLSKKDIHVLRSGDLAYLTGEKVYVICTADNAKYVIDRIDKSTPLFDLKGSVVYHCPIGFKKTNKEYVVRWVGATTSIMSEEITPRIISLGARAVMGKGGMGRKTLRALKRYGAVYLATVGATSALLTRRVVRIVRMFDPAQRLCELEVKDFGPVVVGMDSHGQNLYEAVWRQARKKFQKLI